MSDDAEDKPKFRALFHCVNFRASGNVTSCGARGAPELAKELHDEWAQRDMKLELKKVHCLGRCHLGPTLRLVPGGQFLVGASNAGDGRRIVELIEREEYDTLNAEFAEKPKPEDY